MAPQRGSMQMLRDQLGQNATVSDDVLKEISGIASREGFKLRTIFPNGIVLPDGVGGSLRTTPEQMDVALSALVHKAGLSVHVFPFGIPAIDEVDIHFETFDGKKSLP